MPKFSLFACVFLFTWNSANALEITSDSIIDFGIPASDGDVIVRSLGASPTHVQFLEGAFLPNNLIILEDSRVTIDGAVFQDSVLVYDRSNVDFRYGTINGEEDLEVFDTAVVNIYGGRFSDDIDADGSSIVNFYGGVFERALDCSGISSETAATVNIFGHNLQFNPSRYPNDSRYQYVVGTLQNGDPIDLDVWSTGDGRFVLHNIPEPNSLAWITLACVLVLTRRRRRRNASP